VARSAVPGDVKKIPICAPGKTAGADHRSTSGHRGNRIPRSHAYGARERLAAHARIWHQGQRRRSPSLPVRPTCGHWTYRTHWSRPGHWQPAANPVIMANVGVPDFFRSATATCCYMHDGKVVWKTGHYRDRHSLRKKKRESLISAPTTPPKTMLDQALIALLLGWLSPTASRISCGGLGGVDVLAATLSNQCRWWLEMRVAGK